MTTAHYVPVCNPGVFGVFVNVFLFSSLLNLYYSSMAEPPLLTENTYTTTLHYSIVV